MERTVKLYTKKSEEEIKLSPTTEEETNFKIEKIKEECSILKNKMDKLSKINVELKSKLSHTSKGLKSENLLNMKKLINNSQLCINSNKKLKETSLNESVDILGKNSFFTNNKNTFSYFPDLSICNESQISNKKKYFLIQAQRDQFRKSIIANGLIYMDHLIEIEVIKKIEKLRIILFFNLFNKLKNDNMEIFINLIYSKKGSKFIKI